MNLSLQTTSPDHNPTPTHPVGVRMEQDKVFAAGSRTNTQPGFTLDIINDRVLQEGTLTPQSHEYGEEHSGWVVEQVAGPGCPTGSAQPPIAAHSVTQGAHGDVVPGVADLHAASRRETVLVALWR